MCGRFSATFSFREIKPLYGDLSFEPRYKHRTIAVCRVNHES